MTIFKRLLSILTAAIMLLSVPMTAMATGGNIIFSGDGTINVVPNNPPNVPSEPGAGNSGDGSGHTHDYRWTTIEEATCTSTGKQNGTCRECGDTTSRTIGKARHSYEWTVVVQATCKTDGEELGVCQNCGYSKTEIIKKGKHNFGEWIVTREPVEGEPGERARSCQTCGLTETETFYGEETLYPGIKERDEEVKRLQQALTDAGYLNSKIDGDYGKVTTTAVRNFQKANGLNPDGIAWPSVLSLLSLGGGIGDGSEEASVAVILELEGTLPGSLAPGESATVYYRATNVGEAVLRTTWQGVSNGDGKMTDYTRLVGGDGEWFPPGDSYLLEDKIVIGEEDIAAGVIKRSLGVGGRIWYDWAKGKRVVMDGSTSTDMYDDNLRLVDSWSAGASYEIPLVAKAPVHEVKVETRVLSTPEVNPNYYVPGERIYYDILIENLSETALVNLDVQSSLGSGTGSVIQIDRIEAGETLGAGPYSYVATFDDAVGPLVNDAQVTFTYEDTQTSDTVAAAPVEVWIGLNDGSLEITKTIANSPANGSFFTVGETIDYVITVTNNTKEEMYNVLVTDTLSSGSGSSETILYETPVWGKDATQTLQYSYTVTAADVALGTVTNSALIHAVNCLGLHWESASEDVSAPVGVTHDVKFETRVISTPEVNPSFYVPGEVIYYDMVIENLSSTALVDVVVESSLFPGSKVNTIERIEAGETFYGGQYAYTAAFEDAVGPLVNTSQMTFTYEDTQTNDTKTSTAEVWIGFHDGSLEITKAIANSPANGSFFTEGETIQYVITIANGTNQQMRNVVVTDSMTGGSGTVETIVYETPVWEKDESHVISYSHTVTAADAAAGRVTNEALIHAVDRAALHYETASGEVSALTGVGTIVPPAAPAETASGNLSAENAPAADTPSEPKQAEASAEAGQAEELAVNDEPLYLTVVGTPVDGLVGRTTYASSSALYQAQKAGSEGTGMVLSAASAAENGNQIIYIADMRDAGVFEIINSLFDYSVDLNSKPVLFGPIGSRATYRMVSLMRMRVSDDPMHLSNLTDLRGATLFRIYQTALSMSAARTEGEAPEYGDELLTLVVWDQEHNGQCLIIVAEKI